MLYIGKRFHIFDFAFPFIFVMGGIMQNLTISDIAAMAGVGTATVSRALNGTGYVSEEARIKIEKVIRENEYVPSAVAQGLSRRTTDTVGLIIPEAENTFFGSILTGVTELVDENKLTLLLCNTNNSPDKDLRSLQLMKRQRVCGLIFTPAAEYKDSSLAKRILRHLKSLGCPIIVLDRLIDEFECDTVFSDNYGGAYAATQTLIEAGNRNIVTIAGDMNLTIGRERLRGYQQAMADNNLRCDENSVIYGDFSDETTYYRTKKFLEECHLPVAFFVSNNLESQGFFRAVSELGLRIPQDVAYIGFDDVAGINLFGNRYSFMDRDVDGMGRRAMQMLLERIENPKKPFEQIYMPLTPKLYGSERQQG